jgi:hypothetical protein
MVIGRVLKLLLCFFLIAEKISKFGLVKKMEKYQISVVWASLQHAH